MVEGGKVDEKSYDELVKVLKLHYNPKPSVIVQGFHCNSQFRAPGESIASYIAALRELALHCKYGDKLTEMLKDCLVCGVIHKGIQRNLLAQENLTYEKAYALAVWAGKLPRGMQLNYRTAGLPSRAHCPLFLPFKKRKFFIQLPGSQERALPLRATTVEEHI